MYEFNWASMEKYTMFFVNGVGWTLALTAIAVTVGIVLGTFLAVMRGITVVPERVLNEKRSLWEYILIALRWLVRFFGTAYVEFIRGTPALVQIYLIFYGLPLILGIDGAPRFMAGAIALGLNSAAYIAEIIRGGLQAVDKGQMEAARSLGMNSFLTFKDIVMPQAARVILPALGNEFIIIIKESSVVSVIGVGELMYKARTIMGNSFRQFEPLIIASILYFILTFTLSKLMGVAERRLNVGYGEAKQEKGNARNKEGAAS